MTQTLSKDDFKSKQEVKWCPGCGDYAILSTIQKTLPLLNIPKENFAFISGIGCAGRLPYYLDVYGFHTIHGRATTIATGLKLTRPDLSVWIVTGDGDSLSIGANHLLHLLRRNVDVKILLINNKIYGLTKGQYSPTSEQGTVTPTSPLGSLDRPINPISFALNAGATFVARAIDVDGEGLQSVLLAAAQHKGSALIEIYQNCYVFNNNAFDKVRDRTARLENAIFLEEGKPLRFGNESKKGLVMDQFQLKVQNFEGDTSSAEALIHDPKNEMLSYALANMKSADSPIPFGIFRNVSQPVYGEVAAPQAKNQDLSAQFAAFVHKKTKV